jgi:hypothetical protein
MANIDHTNCRHGNSPRARRICREVTREHVVRNTRHTFDCVDYAASRAWYNDDTIEEYPSLQASLVGLGYLDGDLVDCRCEPVDETSTGG